MNTIDSDDTDKGWKTEKHENVGTSDVAQSSDTDLTADDEPRHRMVI